MNMFDCFIQREKIYFCEFSRRHSSLHQAIRNGGETEDRGEDEREDEREDEEGLVWEGRN